MIREGEGTEPLVTVIMLNHNGGPIMEIMQRCIAAVLEQDYPGPIQLIVVDDNSSDGSDADLQRLSQQVGADFTSTGNRRHGVCAARNSGIVLARGEYTAFLDNDAVPELDWLSALVRFMEANPEMGACASRVMFADRPDVINSMGSVLNELFHGNGVCIHELYEFARWPEEVMYATGNGMMLRRAALQEIGNFDEGFLFWGADDADIGLRLRRAGWHIAPVPEALVLHQHSFTKGQQGMPFWDGRNRVRMALKHLAWYEIPAFVTRDLAFNAQPNALPQYLRCWWSTLTDGQGMRSLWRYRLAHRGELAYAAAFARWLKPPERLIIAPDNRAYARESVPLSVLCPGEGDEPYLYHGWYWPERIEGGHIRWARRVASVIGILPNGASRLRWRLLAPPSLPKVNLRLHVRRRERGEWVEIATFECALHGNNDLRPVAWEQPCVLPPGEYWLVLEADAEPVEPGIFPRQISFGLAGLTVEPAQGDWG